MNLPKLHPSPIKPTAHPRLAPFIILQVSDLRASVSVLAAQQPLLAHSYEVEGLRQAVLELKGAGQHQQSQGGRGLLVLGPQDGDSPAAEALMAELKHQQEREKQWQERMGEPTLVVEPALQLPPS